MSQYAEGLARLVNGSAVVDGSWVALLTAVSGTFTPGETFTITSPAASGTIYYVNGGILTYFITSGAPADGQQIVGSTSGAQATLNSPEAQTEWNDVNNCVAGDSILTVPGRRNSYPVAGITSHSRISLAAPWAEATLIGTPYAINNDFTTYYNLPRIAPGDVHTAALVTRMADLIDSFLGSAWNKYTVGAGGGAPAYGANWSAAGGSWRALAVGQDWLGVVRIWGAASCSVATLPSTVFTLPVGYRPSGNLEFMTHTTGGAINRVEVLTTGEVRVVSDTLVVVHFNLSFPVEA